MRSKILEHADFVFFIYYLRTFLFYLRTLFFLYITCGLSAARHADFFVLPGGPRGQRALAPGQRRPMPPPPLLHIRMVHQMNSEQCFCLS